MLLVTTPTMAVACAGVVTDSGFHGGTSIQIFFYQSNERDED